MYIGTESAFPSRRIKQLLESNGLPDELLDRIIIKKVWEFIPFLDLLERQIIASKMKLNLIIIDSIAGPLRSEYESEKRRERVKQIHKLGTVVHEV